MSESRLQRLFRELKRRKVFRVAGAYLVAAWIVIEVAETTAPLLALPDWVPRLVLFLVLLGFPVALVLAWALELTPDGVHLTEPSGAESGPGSAGPEPAGPEAMDAEPTGPDGARPGATGRAGRDVSRLAATVLVGTGVLGAALAGTWYLTGSGSPRIDDRSLAVLPFETLGAERPTAFTEGVHVGVLTRLSTVADLDVISRTSVLPYSGAARPLPEIAAELGVRWIVRGEVQEVGDQVLVHARLVDARRDRQSWAEDYRRELTAENVFQIQSEIAMTIIDALHGQLTAGEQARVERTPTRDLEAYRLYVQGRQLLDRRTEPAMRESVEYFERAVDHDPGYALARVGLADALILLHDYGHAPDSVLVHAEAAVERALELDPLLAAAHASRGLLLGTRKQAAAAAREMERAIELRPSYAEAHNWASWGAFMRGEPETALRRARRAVELDPLSPEAVLNLALANLINHRPDRALDEAGRARAIQPDLGDAALYEALVHYHEGRYDAAIRLLQGLTVSWAEPGPGLTLALARLATGDSASARDALRDFDPGRPFAVGVLHAAIGDPDAAFAAFDRVGEWHDYWPTLAVRYFYPQVWEPLLEDPRYREILDSVDRSWGLTEP